MEKQVKKPKLLAVSSAGGHWVQLRRLAPAFEGFEVVYVSTQLHADSDETGARTYLVPNTSRFGIGSMVPIIFKALRIMAVERPKVVISTGAAPPLPFLLLGRIFGARTLWVDSIANSRRLSSSGRIAKIFVHSCISQWPPVAESENVSYWGSVI